MANASFTRDEVILALDVLYSSPDGKISVHSEKLEELCILLQELPIHPRENRRSDFRNISGVHSQLSGFKRSYGAAKKDPNVGALFYSIADEFADIPDRLHLIANCIHKNKLFFNSLFGMDTESEGFPEGVLLGHLHRKLERRDGKRIPLGDRCSVCQLQPESLYQPCGNLLEHHLIVDPVRLDGSKHYGADKFITVCPNCHAALHRFRPWLDKENCEALLL